MIGRCMCFVVLNSSKFFISNKGGYTVCDVADCNGGCITGIRSFGLCLLVLVSFVIPTH